MQQGEPRVKPRLAKTLDIACLAILAFVIRCLNYGGVFVGSDVVFYGIDPYGHMRRIALTVERFPRVPTFDYFLNFPGGADIPWPVGFDFMLAAAGWIAGGFGVPPRSTLEALCAWSIPVLGALNVVLIYWIGRRFFSRATAIVAAVLLSLFNAHASISQIGRVDHHVVEPFIVPLLFLFFIGALKSGSRSEALRRAIVGGAVTGASFLFWAGSTLFAALPGLFVIVCFALPGRRETGPRSARLGAAFYAVGAAVLLLAGVTSPFFRRMELTPLALSLFQPLALLFGAAVCALLAGAAEAGRTGRWRIFTGAAVLGTALIAALSQGGIDDLGRALLYLAAQDPLAGATIEARTLSDVGSAGLSWAFTKLWLLAPPALLYLFWKVLRARFGDPALTFLLLWFLTSALLAGGEFVRYSHHLALPLALVLGMGMVDAWHGAGRLAEGARGTARTAALALVAAIVLTPLWLIRDRVGALRPTRVQNHAHEFPPARDAFQWLRYASPDPGGRHNPRERPRYGVLGYWGFGFWINYIAERPNIASPNLLLPGEIDGALRGFEVLLDDDEAVGAALAESLGARYVVVANLYASLPSFMEAIGRSAETLMEAKGERPNKSYWFKDPYFRILNNRMLLFDGSEVPRFGAEGLGSFRLVYESPQRFRWSRIPQDPSVSLDTDETSIVKIFERVPGAVLAGSTVPLTTVHAEVVVQTNQGRKFDFRISTRSDARGAFLLRLPYATAARAEMDRTVALGPYAISWKGFRGELQVSEEEIMRGARIGAASLRTSAARGANQL